MGTICQKRNYLHVRCRWKVTSSKAKFKHFANLEDIFYRGSSGKISFYFYATPRVGDGICGLRPISQKKRRMCSSIRQPLLRPKRTIKVIKKSVIWNMLLCWVEMEFLGLWVYNGSNLYGSIHSDVTHQQHKKQMYKKELNCFSRCCNHLWICPSITAIILHTQKRKKTA